MGYAWAALRGAGAGREQPLVSRVGKDVTVVRIWDFVLIARVIFLSVSSHHLDRLRRPERNSKQRLYTVPRGILLS